ncbi:MAG: ABC transporter substrate-binding protein, partial [Candidatus Hodarchaeota archaeon]
MTRRTSYLALALFLFFPLNVGYPIASQPEIMDFVMTYPSDIENLNPMFVCDENSHWYAMLVYDTLISYDENLDVIPWLAEDFSVSADGLTIVFDIREGVVWHDGTPLTAEDVKFTFEYIRDGPIYANCWE